jgi:hypothetical protein
MKAFAGASNVKWDQLRSVMSNKVSGSVYTMKSLGSVGASQVHQTSPTRGTHTTLTTTRDRGVAPKARSIYLQNQDYALCRRRSDYDF